MLVMTAQKMLMMAMLCLGTILAQGREGRGLEMGALSYLPMSMGSSASALAPLLFRLHK